MFSLRPGELLLAGGVGPFMDDPYVVASEMGLCPLATLASRGYHENTSEIGTWTPRGG